MAQRPGIPPAANAPAALRLLLEPLLDLVARITGAATSGVPKLKKIDQLAETAPLTGAIGGGSTLAQTITKVNELSAVIAEMRANDKVLRVKQDEVITRLQED